MFTTPEVDIERLSPAGVVGCAAEHAAVVAIEPTDAGVVVQEADRRAWSAGYCGTRAADREAGGRGAADGRTGQLA